MHRNQALEEDIKDTVWFFEGIEKLRTSCDRKLTHLGQRRQCTECQTFYYPRKPKKKCPECGSKLKSVKKVMTCPECGYQALTVLGCPKCKSKSFIPAPRDHKYTREIILPQLRVMEAQAEEKVIGLIIEHPVWDWAKGIKGLGETTAARMISACKIEQCYTLSKFFAHYGWGLMKNGKVQRKVEGETISYDLRAQSIAYMLGVSLERQRGRYFEFYEKWKGENLAKELSDGQATSRAFRNMIQLMLSHFWQVWREADGLEAPEPYPYTILRPPHSLATKISPWEMSEIVSTNES